MEDWSLISRLTMIKNRYPQRSKIYIYIIYYIKVMGFYGILCDCPGATPDPNPLEGLVPNPLEGSGLVGLVGLV